MDQSHFSLWASIKIKSNSYGCIVWRFWLDSFESRSGWFVNPAFLWLHNGWAQESLLGHGLGHGNDQGWSTGCKNTGIAWCLCRSLLACCDSWYWRKCLPEMWSLGDMAARSPEWLLLGASSQESSSSLARCRQWSIAINSAVGGRWGVTNCWEDWIVSSQLPVYWDVQILARPQ